MLVDWKLFGVKCGDCCWSGERVQEISPENGMETD